MTTPSIKKIPVVPRLRSISTLRRFVGNPIEILDIYVEQYGDTFELYLGGMERSLITTNPNVIRHVLQKNHRNYKKSHVQVDTLGRFLGNGLLTSEGNYWLQQRRLIQPGFHKDKLESLTEIMIQVIHDYLDGIDQQITASPVIDLYEHMMELAFMVVAKSLFSTSVTVEELDKLSKNLTVLQEFIIKQVRMPFLQPWFKLSGALTKHDRVADESKALVLKYIKQRRQSGETHNDLLEMLLAARYEDTGEGMTDVQLLDESLILFVAGHETTANALSWMGYLLTKHPQTIQNIRTELQEQVGDRMTGFGDLSKLTYLTQVIEESMRLYPPAWITDRVALEADNVDGYHIPKGKLVVPYIYGVHRSKDWWDNPETFDPNRFLKENKKQQMPFAYLPFGGGPRLCIGNSFAMMEMQLILAAFIQRYNFRLVPGQDIGVMPLVTLRPKNGIKLTLSPFHISETDHQ